MGKLIWRSFVNLYINIERERPRYGPENTIPLFCPLDTGELHSSVAKFESKVGSRRTTKIENLVVLDIFLVALILIPYDMRFVLSSQNGICLLEKERVRIKPSKNMYGQRFSKRIPKNIW